MGTDVHVHFEVKVDGKWEHYSTPVIHRNYMLFEKMAGVRGDPENAIAPKRGLPEDASKLTKLTLSYERSDAHSISWLNSKEFSQVYEYHCSIKNSLDVDFEWGYLCGHGWEDFHEYREYYPDWVEDFRLIFWFDN